MLNLHGKTLACHVASLLVAYLALAMAQLRVEPFMERCYILGACWSSIRQVYIY